MKSNPEFRIKRNNQERFEADFFSAANVVQIEMQPSLFIYTVKSSYQKNLKQRERVHAQITPANKLQYIPQKIRKKLLQAYEQEFVREGSYMRHPEQGFVVTFSISSQPTGFFYLDTNEIIQRNEVPSISKHMSKGTLSFEDFPDDLKQTIYQYMTQVESGPIDLRTVGKEVARPMRFYVYPESQGNGSLKVLLSLVTLSTAILNRDKKEIYQLVEARAGIADGVDTPQGSISAVSDHQLVPAYLAKGYDPSRLNGSGILVWNNNPYRNMSITRKVEIPKTLTSAQTKFIK